MPWWTRGCARRVICTRSWGEVAGGERRWSGRPYATSTRPDPLRRPHVDGPGQGLPGVDRSWRTRPVGLTSPMNLAAPTRARVAEPRPRLRLRAPEQLHELGQPHEPSPATRPQITRSRSASTQREHRPDQPREPRRTIHQSPGRAKPEPSADPTSPPTEAMHQPDQRRQRQYSSGSLPSMSRTWVFEHV
jgi:hypothetical protein